MPENTHQKEMEQQTEQQNMFNQIYGATVGGVINGTGLDDQVKDSNDPQVMNRINPSEGIVGGIGRDYAIYRLPEGLNTENKITDFSDEEKPGNIKDMDRHHDDDTPMFDKLADDTPSDEETEEFGNTTDDYTDNEQKHPIGPPPDEKGPRGMGPQGPGPEHPEGPEGQKPGAMPGMPGNQPEENPSGMIPTQMPNKMPGGLQTMPYYINRTNNNTHNMSHNDKMEELDNRLGDTLDNIEINTQKEASAEYEKY